MRVHGGYRWLSALGPNDSAVDVVLRDAHPHPSDWPACLLPGRELKCGDLGKQGRGQQSSDVRSTTSRNHPAYPSLYHHHTPPHTT